MSPKYGQIAEQTADGAFILAVTALPAGWDSDADYDRGLVQQLEDDGRRCREIDRAGGWVLVAGNVVLAVLVCTNAIALPIAGALAVALLFAPDALRALLARKSRDRAKTLEQVRGIQPFLDHCGAPLSALNRTQQVETYARLLLDCETDLGGGRRVRLGGEGASRRLLTLTGPAAQPETAAA